MLTSMDSLNQAHESVFINFSKAFDKVHHAPLLYKIKANGFECKLLTLLETFLSKRSFSVDVSAALSFSYLVASGVLRGSVLGLLLFLKDLQEILPVLTFMYADDVTI